VTRRLQTIARVGCAVLGLAVFSAVPASADPIVVSSASAAAMVNTLIGSNAGLTIVGTPVYAGAAGAAGVFSGAAGILPFGGGVALTTGSAGTVPMPSGSSNPNQCPTAGVPGPNNCVGAGINNGTPGDAGLAAMIGKPTVDAASLWFSFIPTGDQVWLQYVFGSEEYNEFIGWPMGNDPYAIYLNGVNIAFLPGTSTRINASTVNSGVNQDYFTSNTGGTRNIQYDGLVGVSSNFPLVATGFVNPNQVNTLQVVIADSGGNAYFDSGLLLGNFYTNPPESIASAPVPEPGTLFLLGGGALMLTRRVRRRARG
jgi:hypothetical protein